MISKIVGRRSREGAYARIGCEEFLLLTLLVVGLAGCKRDPMASARDMAYFKSHPRERTNELARCERDPDRAMGHPDCINAGKAQMEELKQADNRLLDRRRSAERKEKQE